MPGRSGRNKHRDVVELTETNLAAHRAAHPPRKQNLWRWVDHVALPDALRAPRKKKRKPSPPSKPPVDEETWLDGLAGWVVRFAKGVPGVAVVWREETEEEQAEEIEDAAERDKKRMKGKRWYR